MSIAIITLNTTPPSIYAQAQICCNAASTMTTGDYFVINGFFTQYYIWFNIAGGGGDPGPIGSPEAIGQEVPLSGSETAIEVANKVAEAINFNLDSAASPKSPNPFLQEYDAIAVDACVTVTNAYQAEIATPVAYDVDTGFDISTTENGVAQTNATEIGVVFTGNAAVTSNTIMYMRFSVNSTFSSWTALSSTKVYPWGGDPPNNATEWSSCAADPTGKSFGLWYSQGGGPRKMVHRNATGTGTSGSDIDILNAENTYKNVLDVAPVTSGGGYWFQSAKGPSDLEFFTAGTFGDYNDLNSINSPETGTDGAFTDADIEAQITGAFNGDTSVAYGTLWNAGSTLVQFNFGGKVLREFTGVAGSACAPVGQYIHVIRRGNNDILTVDLFTGTSVGLSPQLVNSNFSDIPSNFTPFGVGR